MNKNLIIMVLMVASAASMRLSAAHRAGGLPDEFSAAGSASAEASSSNLGRHDSASSVLSPADLDARLITEHDPFFDQASAPEEVVMTDLLAEQILALTQERDALQEKFNSGFFSIDAYQRFGFLCRQIRSLQDPAHLMHRSPVTREELLERERVAAIRREISELELRIEFLNDNRPIFSSFDNLSVVQMKRERLNQIASEVPQLQERIRMLRSLESSGGVSAAAAAGASRE